MRNKWGLWGHFNMQNAHERFMAFVDKNGPNGCWVWNGSLHSSKRYGYCGFQGQHLLAHRAAWLLFNGEFDRQLCVCHKCDNGFCVNPSHLFLGSQKDNIYDMENKGRAYHKSGEFHGRAKLNWDMVRKIRKLYAAGKTIAELARMFPVVDKSNIGNVVHKKTWIP